MGWSTIISEGSEPVAYGGSRVSNATDASTVEQPVPNTGVDGIRAAMYGEMAAAVSGHRPWCGGTRDWDVAFEGAIRFIEAAGLDDETSRRLLDEAATTRNAGVFHGSDTAVEERCRRLAAEFRRRIRYRE